MVDINDDFPWFAGWFEMCRHCLATLFPGSV